MIILVIQKSFNNVNVESRYQSDQISCNIKDISTIRSLIEYETKHAVHRFVEQTKLYRTVYDSI